MQETETTKTPQQAGGEAQPVGRLYEVCDRFDFRANLTSGYRSLPTTQQIGRLNDFQGASCPLCALIHARAAALFGEAEVRNHAHSMISIQARLSSTLLDLSSIEPLPRLRFFMPEQEGARHGTTLVILEPDNSYMDPPFGDCADAAARRPIISRVSVPMLRSWVEASFELDHNLEDWTLGNPAHCVGTLKRLIEQKKFRVLDVSTHDVVALLKTERYVALSYLWGCTDPTVAVDRRAETYTRKDGIVSWRVDMMKAPATISDAASVVKQLGEKYLWVDAVCIDQTNNLDKATIIREMGTIYSNAYFTVVAANNSGAGAGLTRFRGTEAERTLVFDQANKRVGLLPGSSEMVTTWSRSDWNRRGWTYQERVLSARCILFTDREVLFTLRGRVVRREAFTVHKNPKLLHGKALQEWSENLKPASGDSFSRYFAAVKEFTARDLRHKGDRLDAFSGVLQLLVGDEQTMEETEALSGLVVCRSTHADSVYFHFAEALLWRRIGYDNEPVNPKEYYWESTAKLELGWLVGRSRRFLLSDAGVNASPRGSRSRQYPVYRYGGRNRRAMAV
ncbi:uncharacterized protein LTR77_005184 [Saxophila tyrrhenica]|uniref:Heterokaryon incompatibility domain-containing protein n=1 Tax=Saxophila tyrrhenica TaxID=1690608 RepID=A0AAV9PFJ4_9PEZI|nr:hypothetical protein LTR77_005184 [Saxophila tyrrhenica]